MCITTAITDARRSRLDRLGKPYRKVFVFPEDFRKVLDTLFPLEIGLMSGLKKCPCWKVDIQRTEILLHFEKVLVQDEAIDLIVSGSLNCGVTSSVIYFSKMCNRAIR